MFKGITVQLVFLNIMDFLNVMLVIVILKDLSVKIVITLMDTVIVSQMLLVTTVIIANMHIMTFQIAALAIVTRMDPKMTLVKWESALAKAKQLLATSVTNAQKIILIFQIVSLVDVQVLEVSMMFAIATLEIVTVNQM